jgi:hypothetical protein
MEINGQINAPVTVYRVRVGENGRQMAGKFTAISTLMQMFIFESRKKDILSITTVVSHK